MEVLAKLLTQLIQLRVRPYYLHHPDQVSGTRHFWLSPQRGLAIFSRLQGILSGLAMPHYVIDLPGGGGKVPLVPESIVEKRPDLWRIRNHEGRLFDYPILPK